MPYGLGIDLGTGYTVAATSQAGTGAGPEVVTLGLDPDAPGVPTVLHLADDGTVLVGAAAESLVVTDPDRVFRGFLHRVGERSFAEPQLRPEVLTARLVRWVVDAVAQRRGGAPQQIALAHPVVWGARECDLVQDALAVAGLSDVVLVPAHVAATVAYHAQVGAAAGDTLAIYDLGATFSTSLTCRTGDEVTVLSRPCALPDAGGSRFDELVLGRVLDELGDQVAAADLDDHVVLAGMAELLTNCVAAREALSEQSEVRMPVPLPGWEADLQLTAEELETLIDPPLRMTVATMCAMISSVGIAPATVGTVLVIGGCAGIPLVTRLLTAELGRPVTVPSLAAMIVARGVALVAAPSDAATSIIATGPPPTPTPLLAPAEPSPATPVQRTAATSPEHSPAATPAEHSPAEQPPPELPPAEQSLAKQLPAQRPPIEQLPTEPIPIGASVVQMLEVPTHPPTARTRSRRPPRALLAAVAGVVAVAVVALPVTLQRTDDTATKLTPPTVNERGPASYPGSPDGAPAYGGAAARLVPPSDAASPPAIMPTPTTPRVSPPAAPPNGTTRGPAPPPVPGPTTPTRPGPTTTAPPPSSSTAPPTSSTTAPPSSSTAPPTSSTTPPPSSSTAPPTSSTTPPPSEGGG